MRIFLLNLPASEPVTRRYMCSTLNEMYFFPPHELLCLAGIARAQGHQAHFTDAVAEHLSRKEVLKKINELQPDIIVSIMSFELFDKDVEEVRAIKQNYPAIHYGLFGHYPTHFAKDTLEYTNADFVITGEPDHAFEMLLSAWGEKMPEQVAGTVVKGAHGFTVNSANGRVPNPNTLPMPPYELLKNEYYREPFMKGPFGMIQSARGCPYHCNYCVHSFGTKLTALTPENVIEQIQFLQKTHGIKSLRFIDDTFTAMPGRVIKICQLMIEKNIHLQWTCLSRADTLNEEMLHWMKKAGCVRLAVGVESGSQRVLDMLDKGIKVHQALENVLKAKKIGFEIMTFYLVGVPGETEEDVDLSIEFAKKTSNYVAVDALIVYPGTPLFDKFGHLVSFSLFPYKNTFLDPEHNRLAEQRKNRFFRSFYFTPGVFSRVPLKSFVSSTLRNAVPYVIKRMTPQ